jgi:ribonuclease HII
MRPNLNEEKRLWRKGYKRVACLDEAGRGPLAGPVVACAVLINNRRRSLHRWRLRLNQIKDSKKATKKQREEFYKIITKHPAIEWGTGRVSEKVIDKINILEATKLAMERAIQKLSRKPQFLILDGKMTLSLKIPQKSIVKADEKVFSCAVASIIAKVTRDRIMKRCHRKYPQYGFDQHKGYPTQLHQRMLRKYGLCPIHRKTFKPVRQMKNSK